MKQPQLDVSSYFFKSFLLLAIVVYLRNVAVTGPYMHNGVFDTLQQGVDFYNRRDIDNIQAEVAQNIDNGNNIGNLGLSAAQVQDLVAFMQTLSDGYQ